MPRNGRGLTLHEEIDFGSVRVIAVILEQSELSSLVYCVDGSVYRHYHAGDGLWEAMEPLPGHLESRTAPAVIEP